MNYYFIYHKRLADIITSYTYLTGRMPLPPLWSLGYQQNRYSYYPEAEVMNIDRKSTRLNSSHSQISYAVFCLKKKIILYTHHVRASSSGASGCTRRV